MAQSAKSKKRIPVPLTLACTACVLWVLVAMLACGLPCPSIESLSSCACPLVPSRTCSKADRMHRALTPAAFSAWARKLLNSSSSKRTTCSSKVQQSRRQPSACKGAGMPCWPSRRPRRRCRWACRRACLSGKAATEIAVRKQGSPSCILGVQRVLPLDGARVL